MSKPKKKNRKYRSNSRRSKPQTGQVNRNHKDRLFRIVFRNRKYLLDLYNALRGTNYQNEEDLQITTLEDTIYLGMKNDLSFVIDSVMSLYEHQSSWNPNMPLRGLFYFAKLYQAYLAENGYDMYGVRRIPIPCPQYVVFYNGTREQEDRCELLLSDAFAYPEEDMGELPKACLECKALVLNINRGHNRELMEKCRRLAEYAEFIDCIRRNQKAGMSPRAAVDKAMEYCIDRGILADILIHSKVEVLDMILEEYDEAKTREYLRKEAREMGWEEGHGAGLREGLEKGHENGLKEGRKEAFGTLNFLYQYLLAENRLEDLKKATEDISYCEELLKEYGL